jgi:hypothetical protein
MTNQPIRSSSVVTPNDGEQTTEQPEVPVVRPDFGVRKIQERKVVDLGSDNFVLSLSDSRATLTRRYVGAEFTFSQEELEEVIALLQAGLPT